ASSPTGSSTSEHEGGRRRQSRISGRKHAEEAPTKTRGSRYSRLGEGEENGRASFTTRHQSTCRQRECRYRDSLYSFP
ncbi:unnamed protein product, partial [Amoebophrya sp. A25]